MPGTRTIPDPDTRQSLQRGAEQWIRVSERLNQIIQDQGWVDINNRQFWREFLHEWTNEDWACMLETVITVLALPECRGLARPHQERQLAQALEVLLAEGDRHPRCLDRRPHKRRAWGTVMVMRELYNEVAGIWLPNQEPRS